MQEKNLYEYAVLRIVPRVEREEFLNVGVILFCAKQRFLESRVHLDQARLQALCPGLDQQELREHLDALQRICKGGKDSGPIGLLDMPSRFRWLTATRSTIVQASKVHPGFSSDPLKTLEKLHQTLVL